MSNSKRFGSRLLLFLVLFSFLFNMLTINIPVVSATSKNIGTTTLYTTNGATLDGAIRGINITVVNGSGRISYIKAGLIYSAAGGPWSIKGAVYDSSWNYIASTEEKSLALTSSAIWYQFNFTGIKPILINGSSYKLCMWANNSAGTSQLQGSTAAVPPGYFYKTQTYGSWPSALSSITYATTTKSIYCSYVINNESSFSNPSPTNGSTGIGSTSRTNITVNDMNGDSMTINWYNNKTGSWVNYGHNTSVANGTYRQIASWATSSTTKYWWKVYINDGIVNKSYYYYFTTKSGITSPTIHLMSPVNKSTNVSFKQRMNIYANDTDTATLTVTWRENSTGTWITRQVNSSFTQGTICRWNYSQANTQGTRYYFRVYVYDGLTNISKEYYFWTKLNYSANNIFVSKTGHDTTGTGTIGNPYLTIQKGINVSSAGKTIYVRGGNYNEKVVMKASGTAGNPITLSAYPGETAVINGNGISLTSPAGLIYLVSGTTSYKYITIQNIVIENSSWNGVATAYDSASPCNNITISGCTFYNISYRAIYCWQLRSSPQVSDINVNNCSFSDIQTKIGAGEGLTFYGCKNVVVQYNYITRCHKICFIVCNNSRNILFDHNRINNTLGEISSGEAIYVDGAQVDLPLTAKVSNVTISNNLIWGTKSGIGLVSENTGGSIDNITIVNNVINISGTENSIHGLFSSYATKHQYDVTIKFNTIYRADGNGASINLNLNTGYLHRFIVANNILITGGSTNYQFSAGSISSTNSNLIRANNLYYHTSKASNTYFSDGTNKFEATAVRANPAFVSLATDFHLNQTSPAIDAANSTYPTSFDFDGLPRPLYAGYDIGADEYAGTTPIITNVYPQNETIVDLTLFPMTYTSSIPTCRLSVVDGGGSPMDIKWFENSTGNWVLRQTNATVSNGTYTWRYIQANNFYHTYFWRVNVSDGTNFINTTYWFVSDCTARVNPGTYFIVAAGNRNYSVSHTMNFSTIIIDEGVVTFNNTCIVPYGLPTNLQLIYIDHDPLTTTVGEKAVEFNYTSSSTDNYFWMDEFKHSNQYRVVRNGVNWTYPTANSYGILVFTTTIPGTVNIKIYDYVAPPADTTKPSITINFAGNRGDEGGPYWLPPGESTALSGVNLNGYYTNSSYQNESWIYINCTLSDNIGVTSAFLHWKNQTTGVWKNTTALTSRGSGYWDVNTSGLIIMQTGHKYTFDIYAADAAGNTKIVWWNKTGIGVITRRYVYLKNTYDNIMYTPLYLYNYSSYTGSFPKKDRLSKDQGTDNAGYDTGKLLTLTPSDYISERWCSGSTFYWIDENTTQTPVSITNFYAHMWVSQSYVTPSIHQGFFMNKTREDWSHLAPIYYENWNFTGYETRSDMYLNDYAGGATNNTFNLYTKKCIFNSPLVITDNNLFEIGIGYRANVPAVISNRSFISFVLLNVPSNATLNASYADSDGDLLSDWTELYVSYTNPFLDDTDNDGQNDSTEYYGGSDPNNYTSIGPYTAPTLPVVQTNDATSVEETTATLNGYIIDDGGTDILSYGFQYGETIGYGETIDLLDIRYYNKTTTDNSVLLGYNTGYAKRTSYHNTSILGRLNSISWNLKKSGYPTGNLYCRVRYSGNDTLIEQSSTILDSTTVTGAQLWYTFVFTNITDLTGLDIRINLEYSATHSGLHFIWCAYKNTPVSDFSYYISPTYTLIGNAVTKIGYTQSYTPLMIYNVSNLLQGNFYHFRAKATNSNGTSYGSDKTFLTKPNAPTSLTIVNTGINNNQILSWTHGTGYNHTILRAKVDGPYPTGPTTDTSIYNDSGATKTVNNTFLLPGRLYYYRAWEYAAEAGLQQYSDSYTSVIGLTKPYAPRNTLINRTSVIQANLTWTKGTGSNNTIIRYKATGYPTSRTDGVMVYNGTGTHYITTLSNMTIYYFTSFSFTKYGVASTYSDNKTDFTNVTGITSAFIINCYDEETNDGLTFNVLITSPNGSQTYNYTGCTNPQIINASLCPQGTNIQIVVSSTGYHYRTYTQSIYPGIIYTLNAYLPKETPEGNGTHDCYQRPYIDSKTIDSFVVDQVITFTHPLDEMISVEIYNASLYGTYGGWLFVSSTKFFFNSSCVTINKSVLDINTTMARVNYYYQFCTGDIESALYYIRVVETIETDYIDTDRAVENAFIVVKRYNTVLEEFVIISSMYTDANGYINLYLIPNILYKIFISKSGYTSVINDYIPAPPNVYGQTIEKVFRMTINYGEEPGGSNYDDFSSTVVFTATMNSSDVVQIYYFDRSGHTINTSIYFYSWYEGNSTLLMSYNRTAAQSFYWNITGLNHTRMYIAVLYFNTTNDFNIPINRITITVYPLGPFNNNTKFDIEDRITDVFGPFKIGPKVFTWIGVFLSIIPLIILTLFDPANVGIGILTTGFFMAGVQVGLAAWTINSVNILTVVLTPVVIFIGVLYIFAQRQGYL